MTCDDKDAVIHVRCPVDLKKRVRAAAGAEDKSMAEFVREHLDDAAASPEN